MGRDLEVEYFIFTIVSSQKGFLISEIVKHTFLSLKTLFWLFFHSSVCNCSLLIMRRATPMGVTMQKKIAKSKTREIIIPIASDNPNQTNVTGFRTTGITSETRMQSTDNFINNMLPEWKYQSNNPRVITKPVSLFFSRVGSIFGCLMMIIFPV
jgi:hypothetical protein